MAEVEAGEWWQHQAKTSIPVRVGVHRYTLDEIHGLHSPGCGCQLAVPWRYRLDQISRHFRDLCRRAGVEAKSFKHLRSGSGSYRGDRSLGHTDPGTFRRHYRVPEIAEKATLPPPLKDDDGESLRIWTA